MDFSQLQNALASGSYDKIADLCDELLLQVASKGIEFHDDWPYSIHLLGHLFVNDLNSARFLWKTIPNGVKESKEEVGAVWKIGQCLWTKDYAGFYVAVRGFEWSSDVFAIVNALTENYTKRMFHLLLSAYSTISVADTAHFLGMKEDDAVNSTISTLHFLIKHVSNRGEIQDTLKLQTRRTICLHLRSMTTVPIICHYDGNLVIDENSRPTYVGGKHKGSKVRKGCNFVELKAAIYKATKIDSNEYDISLVSKWVTDDGPIAIEVNDDDDVDSMFCVGMKVIELFVRKEGVVRTTQPQMNVVDYASQPGRSNTAEQSQLWNPYHSYQPPSIYTQPPGLYPQASGYGFMPYPPQTSGFGFMSYPPQSMPTQMSNEFVQQNEEDDVQTEDMEGGNSDMNAEPLDSMDIAVSVDEDDTWIDAMNLNNDEPLEDIPEFVDDVEDNVEMEEPLEEDQCNDTIMRRSVMHEVQFSDELYGLECVEKGPRVGMIFKSKESLIEHRAAEAELLSRFTYGGVILRPGFIHGTREVGSMKLPLGVIGSPLEMILQQAKPLSQIPLLGPLLTPPVSASAVAKVAVRAATDPVFPPGVVDVYGILRFSQRLN